MLFPNIIQLMEGKLAKWLSPSTSLEVYLYDNGPSTSQTDVNSLTFTQNNKFPSFL